MTTTKSIGQAIAAMAEEQDDIGVAAALGIRLDQLRNVVLDPEDCDWNDDFYSDLYRGIGDRFQSVDQQARALMAAIKLCRILQAEQIRENQEDDYVSSLACSENQSELGRLLDIFGWGFPAKPAVAA